MGYDEQTTFCPACDQPAIVSGQHEFQGWQVDEDEDGIQGRWPDVSLSVHELRCGVCGLHLVDRGELEAAGIETTIPIEDAREEDFVEGDGRASWPACRAASCRPPSWSSQAASSASFASAA